MRYTDTGNLHKDFHLATAETISYVMDKYGKPFLRELFRRTAREVYRDIYESLKAGDVEPLLEYWEYYLKREGGEFELRRGKNETELIIKACPAVRHMREREKEPASSFCLQTVLMNEAWSSDTPFSIETVISGEGTCRQIVRRIRASE